MVVSTYWKKRNHGKCFTKYLNLQRNKPWQIYRSWVQLIRCNTEQAFSHLCLHAINRELDMEVLWRCKPLCSENIKERKCSLFSQWILVFCSLNFSICVSMCSFIKYLLCLWEMNRIQPVAILEFSFYYCFNICFNRNNFVVLSFKFQILWIVIFLHWIVDKKYVFIEATIFGFVYIWMSKMR